MLMHLRNKISSRLAQRAAGESGFTLVELLVVMLILGLLAAIAIPSFFNQRDKAKDAGAKEQVRTAQTAIETYATDNDGNYTGATPAALDGIEPTLVPGDLTVDDAFDTSGYEVTADSPDTGNTFSISRDSNGNLLYQCTVGGEAGCPTGGNWGG